MNTRIASAALSTLLLIGASTLYAAEEKPAESSKKTEDAKMKKRCDEMMKNMDMSKMTAAEHDAMMKQCMEGKRPDPNKQPEKPYNPE
jgi:hypothetical protein